MKMSTLVMSFSVLVFSTIMSMFSSSWLVIWVLLELNTLSYCVLCFKGTSKEAMLKYFIVQTMASVLLMLGSLVEMSFLIMLSLMVKLASAPFHYWFIDVCKKSAWLNNKILLTWQKLFPTLLISYAVKYVLFFFVLMSALVGSLFIINKKNLKEILALSSVFNLSWMLVSIAFSLKMLLAFVLAYWVSLLMFIQEVTEVSNKVMLFLSTITLAGIPPLMVFMVKWQVLWLMLNQSILLISTLLLLLSSVNAFVYLRWTSVSLLGNINNPIKNNLKLSLFLLINFLLLFF